MDKKNSIQMELSKNVEYLKYNGKDIYLIGTAHVSKESVNDVNSTIDNIKPDSVCVELCEARYNSIKNRDLWKKMDIFKVIKEKKVTLLFIQLVMSAFYRKIGKQLDIQPGAEMITAIDKCEKTGAELVLADRNIEITLKRVWGALGFFEKLKLFFHLAGSIFISEEEKLNEDIIEDLKSKDQLQSVLDIFGGKFPTIKETLIDERDKYLSQKIKNAPGKKIVAVVGAGHIPGIINNLEKDIDITKLETKPPKSIVPVIIGWAIPVIIISLMVYGFFTGKEAQSYQSIKMWFLVNGTLSALGTAIVMAHPLTILSAFIAAPITSLNPMIAAGWVAGLVQAFIKKPTVEDFENLPLATETIKGFWKNPVTKILLVVILANIGSSIGTFLAGGIIAKLIL